MAEPFNSWCDNLYNIRASILSEADKQDLATPKDADEMKGEYLREWASEIEDVALELQDTADRYEELEDKESELEDVNSELILEQFDDLGIKGDVIRDLAANCTTQQLEALEMLMRIKKGNRYYASRDALVHPDHVDLSLIFDNESMKDYFSLL